VVPSGVFFSIDIRHPDDAAVDGFDRTIREAVERLKGPCDVELQQITYAPSTVFPDAIRTMLQSVATELSIPAMPVYSAAGHDSRQLSSVCPTGMLFVPCRNGVSHAPEEWAQPEHLTAATRILADALVTLSNS
jgi:beta-ureidopropionase / N-carbamoyl-L-amino-acid hydrolase